ncbi:MAG: hypothetical protein FWE87_02990 [Coriobacteriia bacterium]|nr:hypothetical protein [Coriobacteriia bacterium]
MECLAGIFFILCILAAASGASDSRTAGKRRKAMTRGQDDWNTIATIALIEDMRRDRK